MNSCWVTHSAEETHQLGRMLGSSIKVGDLWLLHGQLGAGKTTLVQGIAWAVGFDGYAHSPTFVIVNEYRADVTIFHIDLYRLDGGALEASELGIDEMLLEGACLVEWADKTPELFRQPELVINIDFGGDEQTRVFNVESHGGRGEAVAEAVSADWGRDRE